MVAEVHTTSVQVLLLSLGRRPGRLLSVGEGLQLVGLAGVDAAGSGRSALLGPVDPPRRTACLLPPQALARLPPLRCRRVPSATPPPPVQLGGRCAATPAPPTQSRSSWVEPRFRQVQESAVRGPLLLLDAPPSLLGAQFRRGVPEEGLSPPTAHAAPVPRHAPDAGRLSDGSAAA